MPVAASVIVRTFNSAATIGAAIASLREQTVPVEIVVVDSGSQDETLAIAEAQADRVVRMPQAQFTFGGALNLGAEHASADVHVALSSHCTLARRDWVELACGHLAAGAAAAFGTPVDGERNPLERPLRADHAYLMRFRHWGFTNHASAWAAGVWRRHRFDERLGAAEDKEWSWRVTADGGFIVADPRLFVPGHHRRAAGVRPYYRRLLKEMRALEDLRPLEPLSLREAAAEWGRRVPHDPLLSAARPFGRTRLVEVVARWRATRPSR